MTGVQKATTPAFDFSELNRRASRAELRGYRRFVKRTRPDTVSGLGHRISNAFGALVASGLVVLDVWLFGLFLRSVVVGQIGPDAPARDGSGIAGVLLALLIVGFLAVVIATVLVRIIIRDLAPGDGWRRRLRLERFAEANHGRFEPGGPISDFTGTLVRRDADTSVRDLLEFERFEVGTARVTTGVHSIRRIGRPWGFVRIRLDRPVPHIVLESELSRRSHPRRASRIIYSSSQRLGLEGDFGRYFTVSVPGGYEADALYVLTPDLMALLVDYASDCDIDLVDDWLVISAPHPFDVADPATLKRIAELVARVGGTTARRTARYSDGRPGAVPAFLVAPAGRRLRHRWLFRSILPSVIFILMITRFVAFDVIGFSF